MLRCENVPICTALRRPEDGGPSVTGCQSRCNFTFRRPSRDRRCICRSRGPEEPAGFSLLFLGPRLLPALALEHAEGPATHWIEHRPKEGGLVAASAADPDRVRTEAGKHFVLELVFHRQNSLRGVGLGSYKLQSEQSFQNCKSDHRNRHGTKGEIGQRA
jgi:hypothetical protein